MLLKNKSEGKCVALNVYIRKGEKLAKMDDLKMVEKSNRVNPSKKIRQKYLKKKKNKDRIENR